MRDVLRAVKVFDMGLLEFVARRERDEAEGCCRNGRCDAENLLAEHVGVVRSR